MADEFRADLDEVKADLATLVGEARGQRQPQIDALESALATLATAVRNLTASPGAESVSAVQAARGEVVAVVQSLLAALDGNCPGMTPSPTG
jgi:hypothetical protein